jgi:hypothetical protein
VDIVTTEHREFMEKVLADIVETGGARYTQEVIRNVQVGDGFRRLVSSLPASENFMGAMFQGIEEIFSELLERSTLG